MRVSGPPGCLGIKPELRLVGNGMASMFAAIRVCLPVSLLVYDIRDADSDCSASNACKSFTPDIT